MKGFGRNPDQASLLRVNKPGSARSGVPGAGGLVRLPENINKFLPQDSPIPSAQEFNVLGQIATAAVGTVLPATCVFLVPAGYVVRISSFLIGATNVVATTALVWTFRVDGAPIPGYNNLAVFVGVAARLVNTFEAHVVLNGPCTLDLAVINTDGGIYSVGGGISGWMWQAEAGDRWLKTSSE